MRNRPRKVWVDRICEHCSKAFRRPDSTSRPGQGRFCSRSCKGTVCGRKAPNATCERCGKRFLVSACVVKTGRGRYCSRDCKAKGLPIKVKRQPWVADGVGYIPATRGIVAKVDPEMIPELSQWNWHARCINGTWYLYRAATLKGGRFSKVAALHRVLMNAGPHDLVDHINGDSLDNRRANLRLCTAAQNARNCRRKTGGSSQYKGVHKAGNRWLAAITVNNTKRRLGSFRHELDAALTYDAAAHEAFGEFARLNMPNLQRSAA